MTESYPVFNPRQDEKFALHGCFEHSTALPRVRRPSHNDFRQILPSQFPKEFSNSSIFFWFWGSRANALSAEYEPELELDGAPSSSVWGPCVRLSNSIAKIGASVPVQSGD